MTGTASSAACYPRAARYSYPPVAPRKSSLGKRPSNVFSPRLAIEQGQRVPRHAVLFSTALCVLCIWHFMFHVWHLAFHEMTRMMTCRELAEGAEEAVEQSGMRQSEGFQKGGRLLWPFPRAHREGRSAKNDTLSYIGRVIWMGSKVKEDRSDDRPEASEQARDAVHTRRHGD